MSDLVRTLRELQAHRASLDPFQQPPMPSAPPPSERPQPTFEPPPVQVDQYEDSSAGPLFADQFPTAAQSFAQVTPGLDRWMFGATRGRPQPKKQPFLADDKKKAPKKKPKGKSVSID